MLGTRALLQLHRGQPLQPAVPETDARGGSARRGARTVTVEAGVTYGQLGPYLDGKGFALHNLASLPHISIAGACSTATHGSGEKNGNLATAVSALELVTAAGDVVKLSRKSDGEDFRGAVVGLGALGVITRITLDVQPTYTSAAVRVRESAAAPDGGPLRRHSGERLQRQSVYRLAEAADQRGLDQEPRRRRAAVRGARPSSSERSSRREIFIRLPSFRRRTARSRWACPAPGMTGCRTSAWASRRAPGKNCNRNTSCPRANAVEAILAVERLRDQVSPHLLISEIRTIAADDLWMSPCYEQPSVAIHFTWKQDWPPSGAASGDREGTVAVSAAAALGQAVHPASRRASIEIREAR